MSSSDSTHPPPLRSAHKSKIHITQFMAHVHVPSLPPSPRKSDCAPVKQRPRKRVRRSSGMGKAGAGDNSGLNDPMHLLQALATAFYLTQRIRTWHRRRRPQHNIRTDYGRGSTQRLRRDTRTESFRDSASVEVVVTSPTKRPRKYAASNNYTEVIPVYRRAERANDAMYTHQRLTQTKNDVAWPHAMIPQNQTTRTMR